MNMPTTRSAEILAEAIHKTDEVQEDLKDAAEALGDANSILTHPLTVSQAAVAVADAVQQNLAAEAKVTEAAQELDTVKELIHDAQVAQAQGEVKRNAGEGTASILAYFEGKRAQAREDESKGGPPEPDQRPTE